MTTIDYKAAMQQALEALEMAVSETLDYIQKNHLCGAENNHWIVQSKKAITALREALAKPKKPEECAKGCPPLQVCDYCQKAEQADEIDWIETNKALAKEIIEMKKQAEQEQIRLQCTTCGTVYANGVPPQVKQAEQEPDYFGLTHDHTWLSIDKKQYDKLKPEGRMVCYASPIRTKDLTDDEKLELARSSVGKSRHWLVEAAIAADREKNK